MQWALHLREDIDRLQISRKEGGGRLASFEDSFEDINRKKQELHKKEKSLIPAASNGIGNIRPDRKNNKNWGGWEEKQMYGDFKRQTNKIVHEKT